VARAPPDPDDVPDQVRAALTADVLDDLLLSLRGVSPVLDAEDIGPPEPSEEVLSELISPAPAPVAAAPEPRVERPRDPVVSALSLVLAASSILLLMLSFAALVSLSIFLWS
jgi:hypothetical protein